MSLPFALVLVLNQTSREYVFGPVIWVVCVMHVAPLKVSDVCAVSRGQGELLLTVGALPDTVPLR